MTILVTGATGTVGRNVVDQLIKRGADARARPRSLEGRGLYSAGRFAIGQYAASTKIISLSSMAVTVSVSIPLIATPSRALARCPSISTVPVAATR